MTKTICVYERNYYKKLNTQKEIRILRLQCLIKLVYLRYHFSTINYLWNKSKTYHTVITVSKSNRNSHL